MWSRCFINTRNGRNNCRLCWTNRKINVFCHLQNAEVDFWIIPIIQGFVQIEELVVNYNESSDDDKSSPETPPQESSCVDDIHPTFLVALISRRSRHRAGRKTHLQRLGLFWALQRDARGKMQCWALRTWAAVRFETSSAPDAPFVWGYLQIMKAVNSC